MRTHQIHGILLLLGIIMIAIIYKAVTTKPPDPGLQKAQLKYEMEKIQLKRENLQRNDMLKFYGIIGLLGTINLSLILIAGGYARAKIKAASVHTAHIGQHSAIPVHAKDLRRFYPIAMNLSLAEIEASLSASHDTAYQISRQMMEDITNYTRAMTGKRGVVPVTSGFPESLHSAIPIPTSPPTFAELLSTGMVAPGKPFLIGYSQGQPQFRALQDLKTVAVAGWQGSGKTLTMAYLVASGVLAYRVHAYIVDPHKHHAESLASFLTPLEQTGRVTIVNPFDTPALIEKLTRTLDRRLAGQEATEPGILLVIDELARLAKMDCFDVLISFLERCTEETRKANITFIGGSPKWTARHFKGRADIRGCMNSMLIHKTKPSQADLLLEDTHDKQLVKQLQRPGEAILVTDYAPPTLVSMPFCTRQDMDTVAALIRKTIQVSSMSKKSSGTSTDARRHNLLDEHNAPKHEKPDLNNILAVSPALPAAMPENQDTASRDVILFERRHRKKSGTMRYRAYDPAQINVDIILDYFQHRKQQEPGFTQADLAKQAGISPGYLSKILRGQQPLSDPIKRKFSEILSAREEKDRLAMAG